MEALTSPSSSWYPTTLLEWTAFFVALMPLIGGAWAFVITSIERRSQRRMAEWVRIHDLAQILHNPREPHGDPKYGKWAQLLAIDELGTYRHHKAAVLTVLEDAKKLWVNHPEQLGRIDLATSQLRRRWWQR